MGLALPGDPNQTHLPPTDDQETLAPSVSGNGIYSESNMRQLNEACIKWISRVSETSTEAKTVLHEGSQDWQRSEDGNIQWFCRQMELPQGNERWVIVRTSASEQRAQASLQRQVSREQTSWERKCWHLGTRRFACEADARAALERERKGKPTWVEIHSDVVAHPRHAGKGRPRKEASPTTYQWQIVATVTVTQQRVDEEALRHPPVSVSGPMNWRVRCSPIKNW